MLTATTIPVNTPTGSPNLQTPDTQMKRVRPPRRFCSHRRAQPGRSSAIICCRLANRKLQPTCAVGAWCANAFIRVVQMSLDGTRHNPSGWRPTTMNLPRELQTDRLYLRRWRPSDRLPFGKLNGDPRVVEFLRGALSQAESDALADNIEAHFERHGFGMWAVEIPGITPFAGFIGLSIPRFEAHFTPCIEIGWRLDAEHWNQGYATEAARVMTCSI